MSTGITANQDRLKCTCRFQHTIPFTDKDSIRQTNVGDNNNIEWRLRQLYTHSYPIMLDSCQLLKRIKLLFITWKKVMLYILA